LFIKNDDHGIWEFINIKASADLIFNAKDKRTFCNNNNKLDRQKVECVSFAKPSRRLICKKSRFHQRLHKRKAFSGKLNLANGK